MGLLGEIGTGILIGEGITNIVVKFSKMQYQGKINELKGLVIDLRGHYDNLSKLKDRLRQIWNSTSSEEYHKRIDEKMKAVSNAQEQVEKQIEVWEAAIKEMEQSVSEQEQKIDEIKGLISGLDIQD